MKTDRTDPPARRTDWKSEPMPAQNAAFIFERSVTDEQMEALRIGNIPRAMEDKWFWYMEGSALYAHRSWTGYCIYRIDFKEDGHHEVTVNRNPDQYTCTEIKKDTETLNKFLDWRTEIPYDHCHQRLSETYDALNRNSSS